MLLNTVIEKFPGMIAIVDQNNETIIANTEFNQCMRGCKQSKCTSKLTLCQFLDSLNSNQSNQSNQDFTVWKNNCSINGKYYQVYRERIISPFTHIEYRISNIEF
ncbi:hypothetical protein [Vibrio sp. B1REV9]|uniref:hypothetical protein n=1 Tax=Vibrio sp. B1REV9 TaxID=2751179 RepID=UPI001BABD918|nr:hypothetical protein [Vibrio sp. B1REV9]